MILEGAAEERHAQIRMLECTASRIEKRRERRHVRTQTSFGAESLEQMLAVAGDAQRIGVGLVRKTDHEEDVDPAASVRERTGNGCLHQFVRACEFSVAPALRFVGRFERHLDAPGRQAAPHEVEKWIPGW